MLAKYLRPVGTALVAAFLLVACTSVNKLYNVYALTAAHPTPPFGTRVKVTNLANTRSVALTVNDRGPFAKS